MNRVEDIIHEIEQQIDPLEKQAEIANLYLSKKAQLKQVEVSLLITEVNEKHQLWKQNLNKVKDRKSTRLNSSHVANSYAVFCLKKKKTTCEMQSIH